MSVNVPLTQAELNEICDCVLAIGETKELRHKLIYFLQKAKGTFPNAKNGDEDKDGFVVPSLTVDALVTRGPKESLEVLLVTRGKDPHKGMLAFPGGFVEYNEDPEKAVLRELQEECGLHAINPSLVTVRGNPSRDPRKHTVTIAYHVVVNDPKFAAEAGDDAADCGWYPMDDLLRDSSRLAFDHGFILEHFAKYMESKDMR